MIDFDKLKIKNSNSAFVGIKKEQDGYVFYAPKGCKINKEDLKKFYLDFFKLQQKIIQDSKKRDGTMEDKGQGFSFKEEKPVFYSNLNTFLSTFVKTEILGINTKIVKNEDIDYSQIDKHLDDALYTQEGIPVVLESYSPKNLISMSASDIVKMYCFVYENIKELANEKVESVIKELSKEFKNKYLPYSNTSIFENKIVANECKNLLDKFKKNSLMLKDFKSYYDALYNFFHLEPDNKDGIIAGIDNFWSIWEELCFNYFFKKYEKNILYADYEKKGTCKIGNRNNYYVKDNKDYPFYIDLKIGQNSYKTYIYPDLIIYNKFMYIIEFKGEIKGVIFSDENFNDNELKTENFLEEYNDDDFFKIGVKEKIYDKLLKRSLSNLNFHEFDDYYKNYKIFKKDKENYIYINITTYLLPTSNKYGPYYNKKDKRNEDLELLKKNLKITKSNNIDVIDFKYKTKEELSKEDKIKQKFYELALKDKFDNIKSVFILPSYDKDEEKLIIKKEYDSNEHFCYIYFNIKFLLREYLNEN